MNNFILSQFFGIVATIFVALSMQMKTMKYSLAFNLSCNIAGTLSYVFSGGISGIGIYIVAITQCLVYFLYNAKNRKAPKFLGFTFLALYILSSVFTYKTPWDIFSGLAAITCALAIMQEKASAYRIFILVNGLLWTAYDVSVGAYTMIISHVITSLSSLVGIIRLDIKWKK